MLVRQLARSVLNPFFRGGVSESVEDANGLSVTTIGPQCESGLCTGAAFVSNGRVLWELLTFSARPVNTVEGFLASFQPIG